MLRQRTLLKLTLAIFAGLALVGCGEDTATQRSEPASDSALLQYEQDVRKVHADMNDAMSAAFGTQQLDPKLVRAARTTATESIEAMGSATPPDRYKDPHGEYSKGLEAFASILADVERQVDDPDVARQHLRDRRFATGVAHLEKASELYKEAGLDLEETPDSG